MKKDVKNAYDQIAETYDKETDASTVYGLDSIIKNFVDLLSGNIILDAGCGGSPFIISDFSTVGLDISRKQMLQSDYKPLIQGDMSNLPFKDSSFDGIVSFYALIHIPIDEHKRVLEEFRRVLKDDGVILVSEGLDEWQGENENWLGENVEMKWDVAGQDKTRQQIKETGFKIYNENIVESTLGDGDKKPFFVAQPKS